METDSTTLAILSRMDEYSNMRRSEKSTRPGVYDKVVYKTSYEERRKEGLSTRATCEQK